MKHALNLLCVVAAGAFLFVALGTPSSLIFPVRDTLIAEGVRQTGAPNLVSAIYLGYRAFDTLGETVVLLLAVSGVIVFVEHKN